jgi:hypothetical protein
MVLKLAFKRLKIYLELTKGFKGCRMASSIQHPMTGEVNSCCSEFIKPLICNEHLTEHIIFARAPPQTFNSLDVFAFCDRRA